MPCCAAWVQGLQQALPRRLLCPKNSFNENLKSNRYQYTASQNRCFPRKLSPGPASYQEPAHTDHKRDYCDDQACTGRHDEIIFSYSKSYRERVDRGCNSLNKQIFPGGTSVLRSELFLVSISLTQPFEDHFSADIEEQEKRDPRDKLPEPRKSLNNSVDTDPADHRHYKLKKGVHSRDCAYPFSVHIRPARKSLAG